MINFKTRTTNLVLAVAAVAALGVTFLSPGQAAAGNTDGPWPEQPSCSNETFTCTSIEDTLIYECFFESEGSLIKFCDDPVDLLAPGTKGLAALAPADSAPAPARLAPLAARR